VVHMHDSLPTQPKCHLCAGGALPPGRHPKRHAGVGVCLALRQEPKRHLCAWSTSTQVGNPSAICASWMPSPQAGSPSTTCAPPGARIQPGAWGLLAAASHMCPPNSAVHSEFTHSAKYLRYSTEQCNAL